jgi:hypothetical protein
MEILELKKMNLNSKDCTRKQNGTYLLYTCELRNGLPSAQVLRD